MSTLISTFDVEACLKKLTREDKIALLSGSDMWHTHPVPAIGVPKLRVSDGPNGIRGIKFFGGAPSNCFPCATGLAASWDVNLLYRIGQQFGEECRAKGAHIWLGPTLNVQRSPLGGRGFESFSEDPLLAGRMAASIIRGVQSNGVSAFPKHFVCNEQELDRFSNSSEISDRALREIYLKAFQVCIREGNPCGLMASYNRVNGVHVSENPKIMSEILRDEWKFEGTVMTDWYGSYSTTESVKAKVDLEMPGPAIWRGRALAKALAGGKLDEEDLDDCARRLLRLCKRASESGIPCDKAEEGVDTRETRALLLEASQAGIVLMKNSDKLLPLAANDPQLKRLAVIGPNARIPAISGGGSASLKPYYVRSPLDAIKKLAKEAGMEISYAAGTYSSKYLPLLDPLLVTGSEGSELLRPLIRLSFFGKNPKMAGVEPVHRMSVDSSMAFMLDNIPFDLVPRKCWMTADCDLVPDESGTWDLGLVVAGQGELYIDDDLVVANSINQRPGTLFFGSGTVEEIGSVHLTAGQHYRLHLEWSNFRPVDPKVSFTTFGGWRIGARKRSNPRDLAAEAIAVAQEADAVVVIAGLNADVEGEGFDRPHMGQLDGVDNLIKQILAVNAKTCVVIQSGMPTEMPWASETPAVVQAFYGGNESGSAIANVLFGKYNPSAKMPISFPRILADAPSHPWFPGRNGYSYYNEDILVGYRGMLVKSVVPLASFGHGLSYTTFLVDSISHSDLVVDPVGKSVHIKILARISNTGKIAGAETLQVYISPPATCPLPRAPKELAGFCKVFLASEASTSVEIQVDRSAFSYWDPSIRRGRDSGAWCIDDGLYELHVGTSLDDIAKSFQLEIQEGFTWKGL